jgi:hypothetical protein
MTRTTSTIPFHELRFDIAVPRDSAVAERLRVSLHRHRMARRRAT